MSLRPQGGIVRMSDIFAGNLVVVVMTVVVAIGSIPLSTHAHSRNPWIGKRVLIKHGVKLRVGSKIIEGRGPELPPALANEVENWTRNPYRPYRAEQVKGPWLWIVAEAPNADESKGWVRAEDVILADHAIDYLTKQIRTKPDAVAYLERGLFREEQAQHDQAIEDYTEAIRLDADCFMAYYSRGIIWRAEKEYDKAIADLTSAVLLDPGLFWPYYSRGLAYKDKGEDERAITDLTEAVRIKPDFISAHVARANVRLRRADYDEAIADYTEALRLNPKKVGAYYGRGVAWSGLKAYRRAIVDFSEAIRLDPKYVKAYIARSAAWAAEGNQAESEADHRRARLLNNNRGA